jgi:hypothetical protein
MTRLCRQIILCVLTLTMTLCGILLGGCTDSEDQAAKKRLSAPPPPNPVVEQAAQKLEVDRLNDNPELWKRINRMSFQEVALRAKSLEYTASGSMQFERSDIALSSAEKVKIVQSQSGDFSLDLETGSGNRQELAFVNDVFFLKNNNGKWRASRDPKGERNSYRDDGGGIWRSFYDLFAHTMTVKKMGERTVGDRHTVLYAVGVKDETDNMTGGDEDEDTLMGSADGGRAVGSSDDLDLPPAMNPNKMARRISVWRKKAHAKSGEGEVWIDVETGIPLQVKFKGEVHVDDAARPAVLQIEFESLAKEIGKDLIVPPPPEAVDEIVRKKWPVKPRAILEKSGILPKLDTPEESAKKASAAEPASPAQPAPSAQPASPAQPAN